MNCFTHALLVCLAAALPARATTQPRPGPANTIAITHVTLIDGTGSAPRRGMTVVVAGERITVIGKSGQVRLPSHARVINGRGKFLIPGLFDTHVHLAWDLDRHLSLSTADLLSLLYLPNGVTSIREASSRGLERQSIAARDAAKRPDVYTPRIYVSGRVDSQNVARYKAAGAGDLTRQLAALGVDAIKLRHGLTVPDVQEAVAEARKAGLPVWGHTYFRGDYTRAAILAGVTGVTHVQGFPPLGSRRRPDAPPADTDWKAAELYAITQWLYTSEPATDSLMQLMIARDVWLEPTLTTLDFVAGADRLRAHPGYRYSPQPYEQVREGHLTLSGDELVRYKAAVARMHEFVRRFHRRGGMVIAGSDMLPFPGFAIHDEMRLLVQAGLTPIAALQAATRNAAIALGWQKQLGTVEVGKQADLVLLDANPLADIGNTRSIRAVMTRGRLLSRSSLDRMLASARAAIHHPVPNGPSRR